MEKPKILVVGSMNMDLFVEGANSIPGFGESIMCGNYGYATGGKGSNQAIAAALQGADVTLSLIHIFLQVRKLEKDLTLVSMDTIRSLWLKATTDVSSDRLTLQSQKTTSTTTISKFYKWKSDLPDGS